MELWDAYDGAFRKIGGVKLVRGEEVPKGIYHLTCDVLVRHRDGTYLLMKRDPRKVYGGWWEASAGGAALAGETPLMCAVRELLEETGLSGAMTELGTVRTADTFYAEFLCETDADKDSVILQEGETVDYRWEPAKTVAAMPADELVTHRMQQYIAELRRK